MRKVCVLLLLCVMSVAARADFATTPHVAGDFNGWDPGANPMTDLGGGIYSLTISGLLSGQRQEFKITQGDWDSNYPGPNSWYYADGDGNITITFNTNNVSDGWLPAQYRLGLSADTGSWTVAGSFQGWDNTAGNMTPLGGGLYSFSQALTAGEYWFKAVVTGSWDSIGANDRSVNTGDLYVNLASDAILNVYVDNLAGAIKYEVIPEPATLMLLGLGSLLGIRRKK